MELLGNIADIASIIGVIISIFVAAKVMKISNKINGSHNKQNTQTQSVDGNNEGNQTQVVGNSNSVG